MDKAQAIKLRKQVQYYVQEGWKTSAIMRHLGVSRPFVNKWRSVSDLELDNRGWKKGKKRKFANQQEQLVIQKRKELENSFFLDLKQFLTRLTIL